MAELKTCPFCGGEARMHTRYMRHAEQFRYLVKCLRCNARMEYRNEAAAIEAWNRRADNG